MYGKTAELMEELSNQQITYDSFMEQNVFARKAEAAAIGLSVEELSKQLLLQKQANALGAQQGQSLQERYGELMKTVEGQKLIKQQLTEQEQADLRRASIQDKFQAAVEKLQDTLGRLLAGPIGDLLNSFADFVSKASNLEAIVSTVQSLFKGIGSAIKSFPAFLEKTLPLLKLIGASMVAIMSASIIGSLSAIPVIGPALGVAAAIAAATAITSIASLPTPNFSGIESGGASMTPPLNPITATAQQNAQTTAPANQVAPVFTFHHVTQLDGQVLTKYNAKEAMKTQGLGNNKR
jgi:ABC-type multidrug transport system fused ATPase/permease subunit